MGLLGGPDAPVLVVAGVTGSGKSTVCRWLAGRGAYVVEADRVGHEMLLRPAVRNALTERFGEEILDSNGRIDRAVLGARALASAESVALLNQIVHPPLVREIEARVAALRRSRAVELIVIDAALHYQFEPRLRCDAVLMTRVDPEVAERRIMARDGITREQARARRARQSEVEASLSLADAVLDTERPEAEVRAELLKMVDALLGTRLMASDVPTR